MTSVILSPESITEKLQVLFAGDASGHDAAHSIRVYHTACRIADNEPCDRDIVVLASLLHDVDDVKLFSTENYANARRIMTEEKIPAEMQVRVIDAISTVSFKGADTEKPHT
ncbi:MAG TPA: HD domain-containing protein, partial [Methanocorpusculum sp.]|nr:HD domain-containing protein [Methanocorpusculum sp.]